MCKDVRNLQIDIVGKYYTMYYISLSIVRVWLNKNGQNQLFYLSILLFSDFFEYNMC